MKKFKNNSFRKSTKTAIATLGASLFVQAMTGGQAFSNPYDQPDSEHAWASFRNLNVSSYDAKLKEYKEKGYRPVDVETDGVLWNIVFRKNTNGPAWAIHTALDNNAYSTKWKSYQSLGYRLVDFETYVKSGKRYYGGIWIKNNPKLTWGSYRNMSLSEFDKKRLDLIAKDMMPIDVEAYTMGSSKKFGLVWAKNTDGVSWTLDRDLIELTAKSVMSTRKKAGYRPLDIQYTFVSGQKRYSMIWVKDGIKTRKYENKNSLEYSNLWRKNSDAGYRLADLEVNNTVAGKKYTVIFQENDKGMTRWSDRAKVNQLIKAYLVGKPARGLSAAISINGRTKFKKGYGVANSTQDAHAKTVYRLASISKAVSGVMGMIAEDKGILNLSTPIRSYLPGLPSFHNYATEDLLTNRSMVRHYIDNDPVNSAYQVSTAWNATKLFMYSPLETGDYNYSTHGYTIFAAALEKKSGETFCSNLYSMLTSRHSLKTLNCENRFKSNSNRSDLFEVASAGFNKVGADNLSWKYAGGGMESNVLDLLRLGNLTYQNRILSSADTLKMTTKPDSAANYAYGWDVGSNDGNRVFAKSGGQRGSRTHLRVYPDKGIVIVLMANTKGSGIDQLARDIAKELY